MNFFFYQNTILFIQENAVEHVVWIMAAILSWPQRVNSLGGSDEHYTSMNWVFIGSYNGLSPVNLNQCWLIASKFLFVFAIYAFWNACQMSTISFGPQCVQIALQWRLNGHDIGSNHQPHHCLLNRLFRRRSTKRSKPRVTGLCVGNSPVTGEFPAQMVSNAENVSTWWRHHMRFINHSSSGWCWFEAGLMPAQCWPHCVWCPGNLLLKPINWGYAMDK